MKSTDEAQLDAFGAWKNTAFHDRFSERVRGLIGHEHVEKLVSVTVHAFELAARTVESARTSLTFLASADAVKGFCMKPAGPLAAKR